MTMPDAMALSHAPALGFDTFVVSARTRFSPNDCGELIVDAGSVVARYFPPYPRPFRMRGWTMFQSIDTVTKSHDGKAR